MKVYVCTNFDYNQTHPVAVFSTKEKAEEYIASIPDEVERQNTVIEEFDLNNPAK